jgi:hypothetical protein
VRHITDTITPSHTSINSDKHGYWRLTRVAVDIHLLDPAVADEHVLGPMARGLHSSTVQLDVSTL